MIKVLKKDKIISITGHAFYADFGKDIVCSAASSIIITSINAIYSINNKAISHKIIKDGLEIEIKSFDNITSKLIKNMILELKELSNNYPENIKIEESV